MQAETVEHFLAEEPEEDPAPFRAQCATEVRIFEEASSKARPPVPSDAQRTETERQGIAAMLPLFDPTGAEYL